MWKKHHYCIASKTLASSVASLHCIEMEQFPCNPDLQHQSMLMDSYQSPQHSSWDGQVTQTPTSTDNGANGRSFQIFHPTPEYNTPVQVRHIEPSSMVGRIYFPPLPYASIDPTYHYTVDGYGTVLSFKPALENGDQVQRSPFRTPQKRTWKGLQKFTLSPKAYPVKDMLYATPEHASLFNVRTIAELPTKYRDARNHFNVSALKKINIMILNNCIESVSFPSHLGWRRHRNYNLLLSFCNHSRSTPLRLYVHTLTR